MRIKLTRQEMAAVDQAAALRWQLARASGVANQKRAGESDDDLDKLGLKAEMAVAKCLGLTYSPQSLGIDNGIDMWFGDVGIDIKATFHPSGKLLFKSLEAFKADAAILVTKTDEADVMDVIGGVMRNKFQTHAQQVNLGRGLCWIMPQDELSPIEKVCAVLTAKQHC